MHGGVAAVMAPPRSGPRSWPRARVAGRDVDARRHGRRARAGFETGPVGARDSRARTRWRWRARRSASTEAAGEAARPGRDDPEEAAACWQPRGRSSSRRSTGTGRRTWSRCTTSCWTGRSRSGPTGPRRRHATWPVIRGSPAWSRPATSTSTCAASRCRAWSGPSRTRPGCSRSGAASPASRSTCTRAWPTTTSSTPRASASATSSSRPGRLLGPQQAAAARRRGLPGRVGREGRAGRAASGPERLARQPGSLGHRRELRPGHVRLDRGRAGERGEPAVAAGEDVLAADQAARSARSAGRPAPGARRSWSSSRSRRGSGPCRRAA